MAKCKNCTNLYNLSDENDVIVGKWCPKINDSPDVEAEREFRNYKCMTQADRIHSMSDEDLAELIASGELCAICPVCKYYGTEDCYIENDRTSKNCSKGIMEWLQSEVEE